MSHSPNLDNQIKIIKVTMAEQTPRKISISFTPNILNKSKRHKISITNKGGTFGTLSSKKTLTPIQISIEHNKRKRRHTMSISSGKIDILKRKSKNNLKTKGLLILGLSMIRNKSKETLNSLIRVKARMSSIRIITRPMKKD